MGIEPTSPAWKAGALPLCYARARAVGVPTTAASSYPSPARPSSSLAKLRYCTRHGAITASGIPWRIFLFAGQTVARMPPSLASSPTTK